MKKLLVSFLAFSFILWILPLGYFIKPSQQKLACDGQRAMCMCCMMGHKIPDKDIGQGVSIKPGNSSSKEGPSGGAGNYFVSAKPVLALNLSSLSFIVNQYPCYKNPFLASIDYVPKI